MQELLPNLIDDIKTSLELSFEHLILLFLVLVKKLLIFGLHLRNIVLKQLDLVHEFFAFVFKVGDFNNGRLQFIEMFLVPLAQTDKVALILR